MKLRSTLLIALSTGAAALLYACSGGGGEKKAAGKDRVGSVDDRDLRVHEPGLVRGVGVVGDACRLSTAVGRGGRAFGDAEGVVPAPVAGAADVLDREARLRDRFARAAIQVAALLVEAQPDRIEQIHRGATHAVSAAHVLERA